jgi:hypothetical protein
MLHAVAVARERNLFVLEGHLLLDQFGALLAGKGLVVFITGLVSHFAAITEPCGQQISTGSGQHEDAHR